MHGDDDFNLLFPIQKINMEKRIVTGIATADNVDIADEQVNFDGSLDAFESWVGNIREMHDPKSSVGKLVNWKPVSVMHKGQSYQGIEVSVYISKGAQNTWEKVKDGTLRGFSIGGHTISKKVVYDQELQKSITQINKYWLGELSLVDNPCNPAGQFTMVKSAPDGSLAWVDGALDSPVNYCATDRYTLTNGNNICPVCANTMTTIGYVESLDNEVITKVVIDYEIQKGLKMSKKALQIKKDAGSITPMDLSDDQKNSLIGKFTNWLFNYTDSTTDGDEATGDVDINAGNTGAQNGDPDEAGMIDATVPTIYVGDEANNPAFAEGDNDETEDGDSDADETLILQAPTTSGSVINININKGVVSVEDKVDEITKGVSTPIDKTVVTDEVTEKDEEMELSEIMEAFSAVLDDKLTKVVGDLTADIDDKIAKSVAAVEEKNDATLTELTEVKNELEKVASSGAVKKSVEDAGDDSDDDVLEKLAPKVEAFWGGVFVDQALANTLGYDS